ncbi:unnamed protein product [Rotaria sp. Silwood2]|nr:unnamed protein product [Rotaria sp. Silwood2]
MAALKANTNLSESSKNFRTGFIRGCPNGRLDQKKFLEIHEELFPRGNPKAYCKYAFNTFDTNDDGTIDFTEFLLSVAATKGGDIDGRLSAAFDL